MLSPDEEREAAMEFWIRLTNQRRLTTLKILCARKVVASLPKFAKQGLTFKLSSVLPQTLCSLVYQEFLQDMRNQSFAWNDDWNDSALEDQANFFAGLEQFDCKLMKTKEGVLADDSGSQPFEKLAAESAPKLKIFKDSSMLHLNFSQFPSEFYSLKYMTSLVQLDIKSYPVRDTDLKVIGLCLSLLQNLTLFVLTSRVSSKCFDRMRDNCGEKTSIKVSPQGLEYLKNLTQLKHLTLIVDQTDEDESVKLVKNCLELMPKLNTVGTSECYFRRVEMVLHEFPSYKDPVELGLEHLVLGEDTVIPSNVSLPNVSRITVVGTLKTMVSLQQFKKLRHLSYHNEGHGGDWSQLQQTLSQVGQLLKMLELRMSMLIDLKKVLLSCPNLEKLELHGMLCDDHFHSPQLRNCVQKLNILKQVEGSHYRGEKLFFDCPGLLHLLLTSCPELEELRFSTIGLAKSELDLINGKMEAGALSIQKLQSVIILAEYNRGAIVSLAEFSTKLCGKNCSILKSVHIYKCRGPFIIEPELKLAFRMQCYINDYSLICNRR